MDILRVHYIPYFRRNSKWILWKVRRVLYHGRSSKKFGKLVRKSPDGQDLFALRKVLTNERFHLIKKQAELAAVKRRQEILQKKEGLHKRKEEPHESE